MTTAKICGLTTPQTVAAALQGGASHLGFNFFRKSPRYLTPEAAGRLAAPVRGAARNVAVTVDADDDLLDRIVAHLRPDFIQLHGAETPARAAEIGRRTGVGVIRALAVSSSADIDAASAYDGAADHLLFDAKAPKKPDGEEADLPGGNGAAFDWTLLKGRRFARPWFLAGGLDPWNVGDAIAAAAAPIVDVSSGVERGAGAKDPGLIAAFLDAVRRA